MEHDDVPLPTNKCKRRSLFEEDGNKTAQNEFPTTKSEIYYPLEYIEKVRTEIEQWKMHIIKSLDEKHKIKKEKMERQNIILGEWILSTQQQDFLASVNCDDYMRKVETFCNRIELFAYKMQYKLENDIERKCMAIQSKIEKDILESHFK